MHFAVRRVWVDEIERSVLQRIGVLVHGKYAVCLIKEDKLKAIVSMTLYRGIFSLPCIKEKKVRDGFCIADSPH